MSRQRKFACILTLLVGIGDLGAQDNSAAAAAAMEQARQKAMPIPPKPAVPPSAATATASAPPSDKKNVPAIPSKPVGNSPTGGAAKNELGLPSLPVVQYEPAKRDPFINAAAKDTIVQNSVVEKPDIGIEPISSLAIRVLDYIEQNYETQGVSVGGPRRYALVNNTSVAEGDFVSIPLDTDLVTRLVQSVESVGGKIQTNDAYTRVYLVVKTIDSTGINLDLPTFQDPLRIGYKKNTEISKPDADEPIVAKRELGLPRFGGKAVAAVAKQPSGTHKNLPFLPPIPGASPGKPGPGGSPAAKPPLPSATPPPKPPGAAGAPAATPPKPTPSAPPK